LCDFGLAREIRSRPPFTEYVSTRWYRSPEIILKGTNYNSPADIIALGNYNIYMLYNRRIIYVITFVCGKLLYGSNK